MSTGSKPLTLRQIFRYPLEVVATTKSGTNGEWDTPVKRMKSCAGLCEDQALRQANMFWPTSCAAFDPTNVLPMMILGMTALYGPYASFDATTETYGGVPLEVCFELSSTSVSL